MNKIRIAQIILVAGVILFIFNIGQLDFNNVLQDKGIFFGIVSNVLLITGMIMSIRALKKLRN